MKEYFVKTQGDVQKIETASHVYIIEADSEDEAQELGKQLFLRENDVIEDTIATNSRQANRKIIGALAILFIGFAIFLSYIKWYPKGAHIPTFFTPSLRSVLIASLLYSSFIIRIKGIQEVTQSVFDLIFTFLNILLISTFISILFIHKELTFLIFKIPIDTMSICMVAIALAWLGQKSMSGLCILATAVFAFGNLTVISDAMGNIWGPVYILTSFMGVLLWASIEPKAAESIPFMQKSIHNTMSISRENLHEFGNSSVHLGGKFKEKILPKNQNKEKSGD